MKIYVSVLVVFQVSHDARILENQGELRKKLLLLSMRIDMHCEESGVILEGKINVAKAIRTRSENSGSW